MLVEMLDSKSKKVQDGNNRTIITSHEKDAIGLCLRIAGINNRFNDMALWDTETATTPDFLEGADNVSMREDQMIINDFTCFGDWSIIDEYKNNVAVFSDGSNRISIMNVNRTPLEETLGVDLFYHNQLSQNYIFVQYKRMVKYDNGSYRYYTKSDSNFKKDLDRMADIEKSLGVPASTIREILDYRLSSEMFYFKFCKENQEILSKDMSAGMYLPKSFVDQFVNSLGQSNVSYNTVGRYFNNTMFIEMVKTGMFGSRISQSEKLSGLIKDIITSGRSAILAIQSKDYDY